MSNFKKIQKEKQKGWGTVKQREDKIENKEKEQSRFKFNNIHKYIKYKQYKQTNQKIDDQTILKKKQLQAI